jgi:predicted Fe-S protein YdhL (DUF1289 family)
MAYSNTKVRSFSVEGNTKSDLAINTWLKMSWDEKAAVMANVKKYKSICLLQRACINYIYDFML